MNRILGMISVGLLISVSAIGQEGIGGGTKKPGRLHSISRPDEVEAIITSIDKNYNNFRVNTELHFGDEHCFRLADFSKTKALTKTDFNKDGFTDLLVMGMLEKKPVILTLMGSAEDKISLHFITRRFSRLCSIARIISEDNNTLVEYRYFKVHNALTPETAMVDSIKLVFSFGDFVEYNPSSKKYSIEKIEYKNDGGAWLTNSGFSIEINTDRTARYSPDNLREGKGIFDRFNKRAKYQSVITDSIYREVTSLLNYSDFPNLNDNYEITATDNATALLKITYDGGKIKTIRDYGLMGTYSLARFYQIMNFLRKSETWKREPPLPLVPLAPMPQVH